MPQLDPRPTKAQFLAMPHQMRAAHLKPLTSSNVVDGEETGGEAFPLMSGAELRAHREALGMSQKDLAAKLKLRGNNPLHIPAVRIAKWEEGKVQLYKQGAIVPGTIALQVLALRDAK